MIAKPKISVIIPVYNVEKYLCECLDSVINQSLKEIEIICVDDGSTDSSLSILNEYKRRDNRVIVLHQENLGAGVARNKGLKIARGEYLSFLDADDFFKKDMLMTSYSKGIECDADIVMFRHERYDDSASRFYELPHMMNHNKFPKKDIFSVSEMKNNFYFDIYGWTWDKIFRREFIDSNKLSFQNTKIFNDMFFTYSALVLTKRISFINEILLTQRVNRKGSITKSVQNNWNCVIEALSAVRNFLYFNNLYRQWKSCYSVYALHMLLFTEKQVLGYENIVMRLVLKSSALELLDINLDDTSIDYDTDEKYSMKLLLTQNDECLRKLSDFVTSNNDKNSVEIYESKNFITYTQKKIGNVAKCLKEHGLIYTLKRVAVKIKNIR